VKQLGRISSDEPQMSERSIYEMSQYETQVSPQHHAQRIAAMLQGAQQECHNDSAQVSDPRAQALFETLAEVLGGAIKALTDYQQGSEPAWKSTADTAHSAPNQAQPRQARASIPTVTDFAVDVDAAEPPPSLYTEIPGHNELHE
jgi:hypothetical protein